MNIYKKISQKVIVFPMKKSLIHSKMSDMSLAVVERESHMISIYTVLAISYTKMIRKKQFFSERD